jgi:2-polyprenyl-3-methyl-5-hydroxy-6-metoxy-1,4-benzoquinol methylase
VFEPHEIEWTREKAGRFWSFMASRPAQEQHYFSLAVGRHVIAEARRWDVPLDGRVLDYGCGRGHLVEHLLAQGVRSEGADFDAAAVTETTRRAAGSPNFGGATVIMHLPSTLPEGGYDVVFLLETIEHLIGTELADTLAEVHRVLRRGGYVVVTAPNEEDLAAQHKLCPDCGCVFHTVQHVSRWDAKRLATTLRGAGFETITCQAMTLRRNTVLDRVKSLADRVRVRRPPNLFYVGRKT